MQTADDVIDFLNIKLGSDALSWKGEHTSIKFENDLIVDLIKIDNHTIEFVNIVDSYTGVQEGNICSKLLIANYQGGMTGASRLSLTPDFKTLSLCCRIDVRAIDTMLFEELMADFVNYANFWQGNEAADYLDGKEAPGEDVAMQHSPEEFFTRA